MQSRTRAVVVKRRSNQNKSYPDYLVHYGILGQKWGLRRFQNEDGTLTEEGKKRYDKTPESETWKKSDAEHLSDEELRRRNNRLQAERQYRDLTTSQIERERAQRRKEIINKVIIGTAVSLAAVAMRGRWKQAASFIGKFGKRAIAKIRTSSSLKNVIGKSTNKYSHRVIGHPLSSGGIHRDAYTHSPWGKRLYNYRPRVSNSLPKSRLWPRT